jgi:pectate lyase
MRLRLYSSLLGTLLLGLLVACSSNENSTAQQSSGSGGNPTANGGSPGAAGDTNGSSGDSATGGTAGGEPAGSGGSTAVSTDPCVDGWASVSPGTTGGGALDPTDVATLAEFSSQVAGGTARVVRLTQSVTGSVSIGSNKTIIGASGAVFTGHLDLNASSNVILRNLTVVGYNCSDSPNDCSGGADAISIKTGAHHICVDHCSVSDGSDGNLDITQAADYVTIGWTKFFYSSQRPDLANTYGHRFSNLIGSDDGATGDTGHLRVTFHHCWWADWVNQRMPRARFGQIHLFNNLYTSTGNSYCVGVGVGANIRLENNVFIGVNTPIDTTSYLDGASVAASFGNIYTRSGAEHADLNAANVFTPPYDYTPEAASGVEAAVRSGAGPR